MDSNKIKSKNENQAQLQDHDAFEQLYKTMEKEFDS